MIDQVNATSAPYASTVDEAAAIGVQMEPSELVTPPRVAESPASIECTLHSTVNLGESTLVLGDVRAITVQSAALVDGLPTIDALLPLSRLGRNEWGLSPPVVVLDRPTKPSA